MSTRRQTLASTDGPGLVRGEILKRAGFGIDEAASDAQRIRQQHLAGLDATRVERVSFQGVVTHTFHDIDHAQRHRSAEALTDFWGLKPSKSAGSGDSGGDTVVNIVIADGHELPHVDAIPVTQVPATTG